MLVDEEKAWAVIAPCYSNHVMSIQMSASVEEVITGPIDMGIPDMDRLPYTWELDHENGGNRATGMVTVVNPGNPTGSTIPLELMWSITDICRG